MYALTNEKGRTRKERANDKYYAGIRQTEHATFVKLCDRLANVQHSLKIGHGMLNRYRKEFKEFKEQLYFPKYDEMFDKLESLIYSND